MTSSYELPVPQWYLDHVLAHAEPGPAPAPPATAQAAWAGSWRDVASHLRLRGDPAVDLALTQGFVARSDQRAALGWEPHRLRREQRQGTWTVIVRGVASPVVLPALARGEPGYFDGERRRHALAATAMALSRRDHVITGRSAATLHGLPVLTVPPLPELTARSDVTLGRRQRALVRGAGLTAQDETTWFGAPCSSVARTVVDLARYGRRDGLIAADAALHAGLCDRAALDAAVARCAGWPHVRRAREVLALAIAESESPLESLLRLALHDSGFPAPEPQYVIDDDRGRSYRVDLCWPDAGFVVEADGRVKYGSERRQDDPLWREKQREGRLHVLGYRVERMTWDDVLRYWPATRVRLWRALHAGAGSPSPSPTVRFPPPW